jgi:hypothetical protein
MQDLSTCPTTCGSPELSTAAMWQPRMLGTAQSTYMTDVPRLGSACKDSPRTSLSGLHAKVAVSIANLRPMVLDYANVSATGRKLIGPVRP